jgi:hypothetical protein
MSVDKWWTTYLGESKFNDINLLNLNVNEMENIVKFIRKHQSTIRGDGHNGVKIASGNKICALFYTDYKYHLLTDDFKYQESETIPDGPLREEFTELLRTIRGKLKFHSTSCLENTAMFSKERSKVTLTTVRMFQSMLHCVAGLPFPRHEICVLKITKPEETFPSGCMIRMVGTTGNPGYVVVHTELRCVNDRYIFVTSQSGGEYLEFSDYDFNIYPMAFMIFQVLSKWYPNDAQLLLNFGKFKKDTGYTYSRPEEWGLYECMLHHCLFLDHSEYKVTTWHSGWKITFIPGEDLVVYNGYSEVGSFDWSVRGTIGGYLQGHYHNRECALIGGCADCKKRQQESQPKPLQADPYDDDSDPEPDDDDSEYDEVHDY